VLYTDLKLVLLIALCSHFVGVISYLNEIGELLPQFTVEGHVKKFALSSDKSVVATLTDRMMLSLHTVLHSGALHEKLKLSSSAD